MKKKTDYFTYNIQELISPEIMNKILDLIKKKRKDLDIGTSTDFSDIVNSFTQTLLPEQSSDIMNYIESVITRVFDNSLNIPSPQYIGHMTSILPDFVIPMMTIMVLLNKNVVKTETAKVLTCVERQTLAMLHRLIYKENEDFYMAHIQNAKSTLGIVTSGGTIANLTALWIARNKALGPDDSFAGVDKTGMFDALNYYGYKGIKIIGSTLLHYSIEKAIDILGIGLHNVIKLPVGKNGAVNPQLLEDTVKTCRSKGELVMSIIGIAGATETGSIDPLKELGEIAGKYDIHYHIDAAWGGPTVLSKQYASLLDGIESAHTVTIDGHKQLYLPMGIGMVILKDPTLAKHIEKTSRYIIRENSFDLGKRSVEGSRPAMSLLLNAGFNILGKKGYESLIDSGIENARLLAKIIEESSEFELLLEPTLNIVNYRYIPSNLRDKALSGSLNNADNEKINTLNITLQKTQRNIGKTFVSRTTLYNDTYGKNTPIVSLRSILANPLTTEEDIRAVLDDQLTIAKSMDES